MKNIKRIVGVIVSVAFSVVMVMDNPVRLVAATNENEEENMVIVVAECDDKDIEIKTNFDFNSASDYTEMKVRVLWIKS